LPNGAQMMSLEVARGIQARPPTEKALIEWRKDVVRKNRGKSQPNRGVGRERGDPRSITGEEAGKHKVAHLDNPTRVARGTKVLPEGDARGSYPAGESGGEVEEPTWRVDAKTQASSDQKKRPLPHAELKK